MGILKISKAFLAAAFVFLCCSCAAKNSLETHIAAALPGEKICRVAVLPFLNESDDPTASISVYRIFQNELISSGRFLVEPEGSVRFFMFRNRLLPSTPLDTSFYVDLARDLQVNAIIRGKVTDFGVKNSRQIGNVPYLTLQVEMIGARNGRMIINSFHRRVGDEYQKAMHFGVVRTMSELIARMSHEIINDWYDKGIGDCQK